MHHLTLHNSARVLHAFFKHSIRFYSFSSSLYLFDSTWIQIGLIKENWTSFERRIENKRLQSIYFLTSLICLPRPVLPTRRIHREQGEHLLFTFPLFFLLRSPSFLKKQTTTTSHNLLAKRAIWLPSLQICVVWHHWLFGPFLIYIFSLPSSSIPMFSFRAHLIVARTDLIGYKNS